MIWAGNVARMGEKRKALIVVGRNPGRNRPRPRYEDNFKTDVKRVCSLDSSGSGSRLVIGGDKYSNKKTAGDLFLGMKLLASQE
jgi:hypothetical protein